MRNNVGFTVSKLVNLFVTTVVKDRTIQNSFDSFLWFQVYSQFEGSNCQQVINPQHQMMTGLTIPELPVSEPQYSSAQSSNSPCLAVYSPNGIGYLHGEVWGAGRCPSWARQGILFSFELS